MSSTHYFTILQSAHTTVKELGSKFEAYIFPVKHKKEIEHNIDFLKQQHTKATHFCYAYKIGETAFITKYSDDGEPRGTAGLPILNQIISKNLTNVLIVVVRYFGGTLLGVQKLTNSYKMAATLVLQLVPKIEKQIEITCIIEFAFEKTNLIMRLIKQYNATFLKKENLLFCTYTINLPKMYLDEFSNIIKKYQGIDFKIIQS